MKDVIVRGVTGVLLVTFTILSTFFGGIWFVCFFGAVVALSLNELYNFVKGDLQPQKYFAMLVSVAFFVVSYLVNAKHISQNYLVLFIPFISVIIISELYRKKEEAFRNVAITFLGLVYITIPLSLLTSLVYLNGSYEYAIVLSLFIMMWLNDSMAYLFGVTLGKRRLFPRISPKKSWEGFIGGALSTIALSYFVMPMFLDVDKTDLLMTSVLVVSFGTFGDLAESLFKRSVGVKDSGKILPGHGGVLDRYDSLIFVVPIVWVYFKVFV